MTKDRQDTYPMKTRYMWPWLIWGSLWGSLSGGCATSGDQTDPDDDPLVSQTSDSSTSTDVVLSEASLDKHPGVEPQTSPGLDLHASVLEPPSASTTQTAEQHNTSTEGLSITDAPLGPLPAQGRVVRYVKLKNIKIYSEASETSQTKGTLHKGDHVVVRLQGPWAALGPQLFVKTSALSSQIVSYPRKSAWDQASPSIIPSALSDRTPDTPPSETMVPLPGV